MIILNFNNTLGKDDIERIEKRWQNKENLNDPIRKQALIDTSELIAYINDLKAIIMFQENKISELEHRIPVSRGHGEMENP